MSADSTTTPQSLNDLAVGMELRGKVTHLELYGAFVDIGIGQNALLHISQLGKPNVRNVEDVVKVGEEVTVYILKVDKDAGKVALSLEKPPALNWDTIQEGAIFTGKVLRVEKFGVFVDIGAERPGMVHVSELAEGFVNSPSDVVSVGQEVQVRVLKLNRKKRQIDLSMKLQESYTQVIEDDEEEGETLTAMQIAFRRAMKQSDDEEPEEVSAERREKKRRANNEQEEILARTLRHHSQS